ncbi:hypothetical protein [Clostridium uliginosum]|uniref:DUF2178 domain-containing protein n=1 Tax=Clostridium uliginosum TaxID=119641 RepID=A0A1I1MR38_9CLOT|nr:hypothetical protein [Clostridium uliginosum]SFC87645.1 hypothetical protein SAMN05421842_1122 [Clostridium uliginosum]
MFLSKFNLHNISFKEKIILRIILSIIFILCGIFSISIVIFMKINELKYTNDFSSGFYIGTGGGLIGAGIATIIKNNIYLKNEDKFKKAEIQDNDERNRFILQKTLSISAFIFALLLYIAILLSGIYNFVVLITLLCSLAVFSIILLIVNLVLKKII